MVEEEGGGLDESRKDINEAVRTATLQEKSHQDRKNNVFHLGAKFTCLVWW